MYINTGKSFGKTRSEQEKNLRKEWGRTLSDEQLSKLKFLEKKTGIRQGSFSQPVINKVDRRKHGDT